jgi:hypothetical protein
MNVQALREIQESYGYLPRQELDVYDPRNQVPVRVATNCDLCESLPGRPDVRCVYACPHTAARRLTGYQLALKIPGRKPLGPA